MKTIATIVILLITAAGIFYYATTWDARSVPPVAAPEETEAAHAAYFQERMVARGVADIGQPIEGFDSGLLMRAFPGLVPADFDGVETFEGRYETSPGAEMVTFVRGTSTAISSAERTVSTAGYGTLLANVSRRLALPITSEADVDTLIDRIDTGERLEAKIDAGASARGVTVTLHEVLEDSRCPADATCIQAGTVRIAATLESGLGSGPQEFVLDEPITTEAETVELVQVLPEPVAGESLLPEDYTFIFQITARTDMYGNQGDTL